MLAWRSLTRKFRRQHRLAFMGMPVNNDWRGIPTCVCICGNDLFLLAARFDSDTRLPGFYLTTGFCLSCDSLVDLPTPIDEVDHEIPGF